MPYATSNPPVKVTEAVGNGPCLWIYNSDDVHTDVDAAGYFTNGHALGMRVGDHVIVGKTSATIGSTIHFVQSVTVDGAATVAPAILA